MRVVWCVAVLLLAGMAGCLAFDDVDPVERPEDSTGYVYAFRYDTMREREPCCPGGKSGPLETREVTFTTIEQILSSDVQIDGDRSNLAALRIEESSAGVTPTTANLDFMGGEVSRNLLAPQRVDDQLGPFSWWSPVEIVDGTPRSLDPWPVEPFLDFPLESGKQWTSPPIFPKSVWDEGIRIINWNWEGRGRFHKLIEFDITSRVVGPSTANVPLGTIDTILIEQEYRPTNLKEWAETFYTEAERSGTTIDTLDLSFDIHVLLHYSPVYEIPVLVEVELEFIQQALGSWSNGNPMDATYSSRVEATKSLVGARPVPAEGRDLAHAASFLAGEVELPDPTGERYAPGGYGVRIETDNATGTTGGTASFQATTHGQGLPDGHTFKWRHVAPDGGILEEAEGDNVEFPLQEPGIHRVELTAVGPDGAMKAAASHRLLVDHQLDVQQSCTLQERCQVDVPARPGVQALALEAQPTNPLFELAPGRLVLENATGATIAETQGPGTLRLGLDEFPMEQLSYQQDWILYWHPENPLLDTPIQDVEYHLEVLFTAPQTDPAPTGDGRATSGTTGAQNQVTIGLSGP